MKVDTVLIELEGVGTMALSGSEAASVISSDGNNEYVYIDEHGENNWFKLRMYTENAKVCKYKLSTFEVTTHTHLLYLQKDVIPSYTIDKEGKNVMILFSVDLVE